MGFDVVAGLSWDLIRDCVEVFTRVVLFARSRVRWIFMLEGLGINMSSEDIFTLHARPNSETYHLTRSILIPWYTCLYNGHGLNTSKLGP